MGGGGVISGGGGRMVDFRTTIKHRNMDYEIQQIYRKIASQFCISSVYSVFWVNDMMKLEEKLKRITQTFQNLSKRKS